MPALTLTFSSPKSNHEDTASTMHLPHCIKAAKQHIHNHLSCKDINKLRKPRLIQQDKRQKHKIPALPVKSDWILHDLSIIFEDIEPLLEDDCPSSRQTSYISSTSTNSNLLDDPAILKLSSPPTIDDLDAHRASDKIPLINDHIPFPQDPPTTVEDIITLQHRDLDHLSTLLTQTQETLGATQHDLAYHASALRNAHAELQYLRNENAMRFEQNRDLAAQVRDLEGIGGLGRKGLKQVMASLSRELRGREEVVREDGRWIEGLQERVWAWEDYAEGLEGRNGVLEGWVRGRQFRG